MKYILLLAICMTVASASQRADGTIAANLNQIVDNVLPIVKDLIYADHLDPMTLPDIVQSFEAKPLFITYTGILNLTNGILSHLGDLRRRGDAILTYQNRTLDLDIGFRLDSLDADYDYKASIAIIKTSGQLTGTGRSIATDVGFTADLNKLKITLKNLKITSIGSVGASFRGNPIVDWLSNALANVVTVIFKNKIVSQIESQVTIAIDNELDIINDRIENSKS